ncbi:Protein STB5 [Colletotrichum higginsianum]|uniref:Protein STB5 n=1 Tax=Colletotrichum higginsianum TaxID=80884 RepID=A0A4T0W434_9PEZI|nr:Protein STB5 [Colletotrichum higginsianum]
MQSMYEKRQPTLRRNDEGSTPRAPDRPAAGTGHTAASVESSDVSPSDVEGLGFMASLFTDPDLRRNNTELLQILAKVPNAPEPSISPCELPSSEDAEFLFERYIDWSHVQSPFLCRDEIRELRRRLFSFPLAGQSAPDHDLFRAFMILAVGSVFPYRNGAHHQHPEGYYLAALQHLGADFLTRGLDSVQDLLLVCRFGIYHRIGTSIWDVIRLCGRLCIEQGLHLNDQPSKSLLHAQMKRRVFWYFYIIDRYSSTLLGKPFTINDRDIETSFPVDANDEDLVAADQSLRDLAAFQMTHVPLGPSEMTVFFTAVRLRQISSRIHTEFSKLSRNHFEVSRSHLAPGHIYTTLTRLMRELQEWRDHAPVFPRPKCLYESQDWFDLLLAREQLYLVRRAIDLVPKREGKTPRHVSVLYLKTALRTIEVYSLLCQNRPLITHTRSYFHMMFTAGLSVIFCVSAATALDVEDVQSASAGLTQCEETLRDMVEQLASARHYVVVFEALRHNTFRKLNRVLEALRPDNGHQCVTADPSASTRPSGFSAHSSHPLPSSLGRSGPTTRNIAWKTMAGDATTYLFTGRSNFGSLGITGNPSPSSDLLDWAFLNDETLWNMETVLGEYVYGDPSRHAGFDGFEF